MKASRILALCACIVSAGASADTLKVTVSGVKAGQGNLLVGVFNESRRDQFAEGMYLYGTDVPARQSEMTIEIPFVEPGQYAVAVIQDLNQNQKLDRNAVKMPKKPYGFSGAWDGGLSSSYEKALFDTEKDGFAITIKLR